MKKKKQKQTKKPLIAVRSEFMSESTTVVAQTLFLLQATCFYYNYFGKVIVSKENCDNTNNKPTQWKQYRLIAAVACYSAIVAPFLSCMGEYLWH